MSSKHTKRGRRARRRAHHTEIAAEALNAYVRPRRAAWLRRATTEGLITYRGITMLGGAP